MKDTVSKILNTTALLATMNVQTVLAQGVPVIDSANLAQNVEQIQQHLADAERQLEQIEQLQAQIKELTDINALLDSVLSSITGLNDIANLYYADEDIRSRAAKITQLSGFMDALSIGDIDALLDNLLDDEVTMGDKMAQDAVFDILSDAGFTQERLEELSSSENVSDGVISQTAAANVTVMAAAQLSYEEAEQSLTRIDGLVEQIASAETLKESVDLNTRMAAETSYMLGQMWRLNAAQGLASGQNGINWAAEQAKERTFFEFSGAPE